MAAFPALLLSDLAQADSLVVAGLQRFFGLEEQFAEANGLKQVACEQEDAGDDASVVVSDIRCDDVGSDGDCEQQKDEQVDAVVPVLGEVIGALREVADDAAWGKSYRSSAMRKAMNISTMAAMW